jgi:DNA (cytosine-5)-methyltransferase 1
VRLLDLFCGAGGAGMGYARAGFDVTGVDHRPQPRFPFPFIQADALEYVAAHGHEYDVIHASPPCQGYLNEHFRVTPSGHVRRDHPRLIGDVRALLVGHVYVIENIQSARRFLCDPVELCGSSFGLPVRRHRLFEMSERPALAPQCSHHLQRIARYPTQYRPKNGQNPLACVVQVYGNGKGAGAWGPAMGIDWMRREELAEAIPPAYTEWIGRQLLAHIDVGR